MSENVVYNALDYRVPDANDPPGWGASLTEYLVALATGSLTFSLLVGIAAGQVLASDGMGGVQFINAPAPSFPLGASNGSVTAPSYAFASSTNTGMYSAGSHLLNFATNGTLALSISATQAATFAGALTAGATTVSTLTASGNVTMSNGVLTITDGSTAYPLILSGASTTTAAKIGVETNNFVINAGGSDRVTVTSTGFLGVGITPTSIVHASGGAASSEYRLDVSATTDAAQIHFNRGSGKDTLIGPSAASNFDLSTSETIPIRFLITSAEVARLSSTGQLLVGATTSSGTTNKLTVAGTNNTDVGVFKGSSTNYFTIQPETSTGTAVIGYWTGAAFGTLSLNGASGTVLAPTPTVGDNTTKVATTAFVKTALGTAVQVINSQTFSSTGTYTPTTGMIYCTVRIVGGGGGSGGVNNCSSSGGGSGGYAEVLLTAAQVGASKTVTIGAAGTAGAIATGAGAGGGTTGGTGGTTSLGSLISCTGGAGGQCPTIDGGGAPSQGGAGGTATVTTGVTVLNMSGLDGGYGGLAAYASAGFQLGGGGGSNPIGQGGVVTFSAGGFGGTPFSVGTSGVGFGGGGSGSSDSTNTNRTGIAGSKGGIIITEYCT